MRNTVKNLHAEVNKLALPTNIISGQGTNSINNSRILTQIDKSEDGPKQTDIENQGSAYRYKLEKKSQNKFTYSSSDV